MFSLHSSTFLLLWYQFFLHRCGQYCLDSAMIKTVLFVYLSYLLIPIVYLTLLIVVVFAAIFFVMLFFFAKCQNKNNEKNFDKNMLNFKMKNANTINICRICQSKKC